MDKILFTSTVDSHILNFHTPFLKLFYDKNYEVHIASNGYSKIPYVTKKYNIPFQRNPFSIHNLKAYRMLKSIIEEERYLLIHCHTPVASVLTRLAARKSRKIGTKLIYTAHGFHFYKNAPIKNWILYYPIEKWLSRYIDCLITINKEDYDLAIRKKFKTKHIKQIKGMGVDLSKFHPITPAEKERLRQKYKFQKNDFILIYPAELNINKNQYLLIETIKFLKNKIPRLFLILPGDGVLFNTYKKIVIDNDLSKNIVFPGFVKDIDELVKISDISVASSIREGLGLNIIQGMACGLPIIASNNRGHRELINNNVNGYLINLEDPRGFADAVYELYLNKEKRIKMGKKSLQLVNRYSLINIKSRMLEIYNEILNGEF